MAFIISASHYFEADIRMEMMERNLMGYGCSLRADGRASETILVSLAETTNLLVCPLRDSSLLSMLGPRKHAGLPPSWPRVAKRIHAT